MKQKQRDQIILPASRGNASTTVLDRAFARVRLGKVFARPKRTGSTSVTASSARRPGPRGHKGRGLGEAQLLHPIREMRGTNYQVCGLFPFPMGGGSPLEGVPLGRNLLSGEPVCCDPISWFLKLRVISNPSAFVMANPGLGKSSLLRRMAIGLAAFGVWPLILGDIKGEHVAMIEHLGGAVLPLGRGVGHINPLDDCGAVAAAKLLSAARAEELLDELHSRRRSLIASLIAILRKKPLDEREESILDRCLTVLETRHAESSTVPVMADLRQVLKDKPVEVREVALDRGDDARYEDITEGLESSLNSLCGAGAFGQMFAHPSTNRIDASRPMVFDLSRISQTESDLRAATLMACWSAGFGTVTTSNMLADDGVIERQRFLVILDELWNTLAAGPGIVDQVNALTRLNREWGVGQIMASHTPSDLMAVRGEEDRAKAKGIMDRCGIKILGGLAKSEMPLLTESVPLSMREQEQLANWQDPPAWNRRGDETLEYTNDDVYAPTDQAFTDVELNEWLADDENAAWYFDDRTTTPPPGQGKFFIKVGSRAGIPFAMEFTPTERRSQVHDTEKKWHEAKSRAAQERGER
ncbi:ATP/GTP-binding protein [Kocuria sp. cx-116]|uniref:ATP/GTP-binding protein n=1 Tax=Kocuria sp. cx-116 TaxID=2771378 RepID=UPI0016870C12|nr:ATP/GTP-binding protein [Kocuria sp. cx-116]MBD2763576.1 ATP/GTP-binding protein [Kocuria sp. cx-116]